MNILTRTVLVTMGLALISSLCGTELSSKRYQSYFKSYMKDTDEDLAGYWKSTTELYPELAKQLQELVGEPTFNSREFKCKVLAKDMELMIDHKKTSGLQFFIDYYKNHNRSSSSFTTNNSSNLHTSTQRSILKPARTAHASPLSKPTRYILYTIGSIGMGTGAYLLYRSWKNRDQYKTKKQRPQSLQQVLLGAGCFALGAGAVWYTYTHS